MKVEIKGRTKGSKGSSIGHLYILLLMFLIIGAAIIMSGGFVPIDPNGPGGPPTLPPYFDNTDSGQQRVILPSGALTPDPKGNLQLKTFLVNVCGEKTAVYFLIDTSGSMAFENKLGKEKTALQAFVKQLAGNSVIGMSTFSKSADEKVSISYYKDVKQQVADTIAGLKAQGWTVTREAMELAKQKLSEAISQNKFPGYKYNLVLLTDGVPEVPPSQPRICEGPQIPDPNTAPALRCFAQEQDPRVPTNVAQEIKNIGVDIYAINIYSPNYPSDAAMHDRLVTLLKEIASPTLANHYYETINANDLNKVLDNVINNVCNPINF